MLGVLWRIRRRLRRPVGGGNGRRLLAGPMLRSRGLVGADPGGLVAVPEHPFLQPGYTLLPARPTDPQLLMPAFGVVPFTGRDDLIDGLREWAGGPDAFGVRW